MSDKENENLNLTEAAKASKPTTSVKSRLQNRIPALKNKFKMNLNAAMATKAVSDYVDISLKNPKASSSDIFRKLGRQKQDAVSKINQVVPIPLLINAPDSQFRRVLRDIKEENKMINEQSEFNPPPMLLLKRLALRMFPDGKRVVLYIDNKYGLSFPVPYDAFAPGFSTVNTLKPGAKVGGLRAATAAAAGYVNEETVPVIFSTGEEILVEKVVMDKIKKVFDSLNEQNKERLSDMILESKETFDKVKEFASLIE